MLDITKNIIAMGIPATGIESFYRNCANESLKFFETRHPKSYKIYNLY